jgi:H+/Cl- antiporter ClcA
MRSLTQYPQLGITIQRWIAVVCLLLVLVFTGVEAVHIHSSDANSGSSGTPCLICMSAQARAPVLTANFLPVLCTVGVMVIADTAQGHGVSERLAHFTRPPPAA